MYYITNHACERFLERELGYITWTSDDIRKARKVLKSFVYSYKHKTLYKDIKEKILFVLVDKFILIFNERKKVLLTLYPFNEKKINYLEQQSCKQIKIPKKFQALKVKGKYPEPNFLSVSISETKNKIHISINDHNNPYNLSGCFGSIDNAQKFIDDYTKFYKKNFVMS